MNEIIFLFDLDDTLVGSGYASWAACSELLNEFLQSKGVAKEYSADFLGRTCIGIPLDSFVRELAQEYEFCLTDTDIANLTARAESAILEYFKKHLKPDAQVSQALNQLRQQHHKIGIVSSSSRTWIDACLSAANFTEFVRPSFIFSARSSAVAVKPDPAIYVEALSHLPARSQVIAIEDSPSGVRSAKAAGIQLILGCLSFSPPDMKLQQAQRLLQLGATTVFHTWKDFATAVNTAC